MGGTKFQYSMERNSEGKYTQKKKTSKCAVVGGNLSALVKLILKGNNSLHLCNS